MQWIYANCYTYKWFWQWDAVRGIIEKIPKNAYVHAHAQLRTELVDGCPIVVWLISNEIHGCLGGQQKVFDLVFETLYYILGLR